MTRTAQKLLTGALALPENERVKLASELLASVPQSPDPDWDSAWLAELDRRVKDVESGKVKLASWETTRRRLRAAIRRGHAKT